MKKINSIFLIPLIVLFISCSSSKKTQANKNPIDGNWQLKTIVSQGTAEKINSKFFNEAGFDCFVGSTWTFNSSSYFGTYWISKNIAGCTEVKRNINWFIEEIPGQPKQFQFKRLDGSLKAIDDKEFFRFTIIQMDENTMQFRSENSIDGQPASFTYNFIRI